jgi:hypothetical protein
MDKGMIFVELDDTEEIQLPGKTTINNTEEINIYSRSLPITFLICSMLLPIIYIMLE